MNPVAVAFIVLQTKWGLQGYIALYEYNVNGIVYAWMCYENVCFRIQGKIKKLTKEKLFIWDRNM